MNRPKRKTESGLARRICRRNGFYSDSRTAFYAVSLLGIISFFFLVLYYGRPAYVWMVQENQPGIRFTDYFLHLTAAVDRNQLYQSVTDVRTGCFPPLAYLMYYFLYRLTPLAFETVATFEEMELIPGTLHVFTYYLIFSALFFFLGISRTGQRNLRRDVSVFILLMLSAVFFGSGYMMGNSAMLVLAMLVMAFALRDSGKAWQRETALILFALSVGFKLYPAVFGLLYLKEKRYRELGRFIVYSLTLVFLPFAFFGGLAGMQAWIGNILGTMQSSDFGRLQYLKGVLFSGLKLLSGQELPTLAAVLSYLICALWAILAWRSRNPLRSQFFLICIMAFFPSNAFRYSLAYFAIPLIACLKADPKKDPEKKPGWIIMALYGLLFTIPTWWAAVSGLERRYEVYALTSVEICLYLTAYLLVAAVTAAELAGGRRRKGNGEAA